MFGVAFPPHILESNFSFEAIATLQCKRCQTIRYDPCPIGNAAYYEYLGSNLFWYYAKNRWEYPIVLETLENEQPKSFLEVGCGDGHFLRMAQKKGYEGHGYEINPHSLESLRADGFHILTDLDHGVPQYDIILMFQVLEHLSDPCSSLKALLPHLHPGGAVVLTTPITPSCAAMTANPFLLPPHHLWLPTVSAFEHLGERLGLVCERTLCEPPDYELVAYALKKWCGGVPYSEHTHKYWQTGGRRILKLATLMGFEWTKVGHTGLAVLRKPASFLEPNSPTQRDINT